MDWLIVGGGVHGAHIAARLVGEVGVAPERLRIVDPGSRLLARWRACTETTGMTHLRSPVVHHIGLDPWSLRRFAGKRMKRRPDLFAPPYDRPALDLFNEHCDHVVETLGLAACHVSDRVIACSVECAGVHVQLQGGAEYVARQVVLAIGASDQPEWPSWAQRDDARIHHVFSSGFEGWPVDHERVAVVGGGISAGQVALRLLEEGHEVHLVSRHALRQHQFDSDPGWLGPKFMRGFDRERDVDRRRALITAARYRGSVSPDIQRALRRAIRGGRLQWHEAEIAGGASLEGGYRLAFFNSAALEVDRVLLATGFAPRRPGGAMVDALVESASLPCAQCGYPVVDEALRWHPRIYVSGPLAELELGPASRNIAGARRAADRLVDAVRRGAAEGGSARV